MDTSVKKRFVAVVVLFAIIVGFIIYLAITENIKQSTQNQFGDYTKIQNYDQKIKNLSSTMKDSIQSSLSNVIKKNNSDTIDPHKIEDAVIRESSETQDYDSDKELYTGAFIVDIESIKQSYVGNYTYSTSGNEYDGASAIYLTCPTIDDLKYGEFKCTDLVQEQSVPGEDILQYLPYDSFSFSVRPDTTAEDGHLVLKVTLSIPDSDLAGDEDSKIAIIAQYKQEVRDWIKSTGVDPDKYPIEYNYSDEGQYYGSS